MCTGAPAFGTREYTKAAQATGQLARQIVVRFRGSNVAAANEIDAQAAYESQMAIGGAMMGGAHLLNHCAGWMHGGLTASFEKLILDAETLQMMDAYFSPLVVDDATLAPDAIREAGPAGHFFGTAHTRTRYETAFHTPLLSD
jgi:trimethylamine---corrinoid protein Co-methyltransferase